VKAVAELRRSRKSSRATSNFCDCATPEHHPTLHTILTMRPLTEPETKTLFEKLASYCGKGISNLIADPSGGSDRNVFRVQVYFTAPCTRQQNRMLTIA
jgi:hypothetical protein